MNDYEETKPLTRRQDQPGYADQVQARLEKQKLDYLNKRLNKWAGTGKPELAKDRAIFSSILGRHARVGNTTVNANDVRKEFLDEDGDFIVSPQSYSAMFRALASLGVLEVIGTVKNDDAFAGNAGKTINDYRYKDLGGR